MESKFSVKIYVDLEETSLCFFEHAQQILNKQVLSFREKVYTKESIPLTIQNHHHKLKFQAPSTKNENATIKSVSSQSQTASHIKNYPLTSSTNLPSRHASYKPPFSLRDPRK
jgi:hypothetical protein